LSYVTEEQALKMQCRAVPFLTIQKMSPLGGSETETRITSCAASACMMWRWGAPDEGEQRGSCGLAIPPQHGRATQA
jgi:hypothetical protein